MGKCCGAPGIPSGLAAMLCPECWAGQEGLELSLSLSLLSSAAASVQLLRSAGVY